MWGIAWNIFAKKEKQKLMNGIDISHFQGSILWDKVKGIDFVYIKASEGISYVDSRLSYNATEAKKNNIPIGYYHFSRLHDPKLEVAHFLSTIATLPKPDLPLVLDIEENTLHLSHAQIETWVTGFFAALMVAGHTDYVLYSYTPFLNSNLPPNHSLGGIRLWIAAYTPTLKLPHGWVKEWLWQYSNNGNIAGISGAVDLNKSDSRII